MEIELKHAIMGTVVAIISFMALDSGMREGRQLNAIAKADAYAPEFAESTFYENGSKSNPINPLIKRVEWKTVKMNVSAYCPCEKCCEDFADGITASGHKIKAGDFFVAAPREYSFGTEMKVPGYNNDRIVKVEDVGGAIKGNKLDLFFHTHQDALDYGRKEVDVKVRI